MASDSPFDWTVFSYIGLIFAIIYRIPQIVKIVQTKSAADLSSYSYLTHNGAYLCFILYLVGTGKTGSEWVLCFYYFMGIAQNLLIFGLKKYYSSRQPKLAGGVRAASTAVPIGSEHVEVALSDCTTLNIPPESAASGEGDQFLAGSSSCLSRDQYLKRRVWFKARAQEHRAGHK